MMRVKRHLHHKTALRKPAKKHKPIYYVAIFGIFLFLCLAIYGLFFSSALEIKNIEVLGAQKTDPNAIRDLAFSKMQRVAFVSGKNIFFVPSKNIETEIFSQFPYLKNVQIQKNFPNVLKIVLQERQPIALWCPCQLPEKEIVAKYASTSKEVVPILGDFQQFLSTHKSAENQNINCFLLDEDGVIFESASNFDFKIISQQKDLKIGSQVIDREVIKSIVDLRDKISQKTGLGCSEAFVFNPNQINIKTNESWWAYFNPKKDLDWQVNAMKTVIDNKVSEDKRSRLKYIDLRFENISFYPNF